MFVQIMREDSIFKGIADCLQRIYLIRLNQLSNLDRGLKLRLLNTKFRIIVISIWKKFRVPHKFVYKLNKIINLIWDKSFFLLIFNFGFNF